eukprot:1729074-Prymnesium_polylepis.1
MNPAPRVAAVYANELRQRAADFDVIAFAIFHAGYGPNNFAPFEAVFDKWARLDEEARPSQPPSAASPSASS